MLGRAPEQAAEPAPMQALWVAVWIGAGQRPERREAPCDRPRREHGERLVCQGSERAHVQVHVRSAHRRDRSVGEPTPLRQTEDGRRATGAPVVEAVSERRAGRQLRRSVSGVLEPEVRA
eukprot:2550917-Prymnesium_polylepis.1